MIKTYSEFIKEAFGSGYGLSVTFVNKGGRKIRETRTFSTVEGCRRFMIEWVEKHSNSRVEYFDICSGTNYSDPDSLEVWGGYGGYFFNIANSSYKGRQQFSYKELKNIENCEVEIDSYLKTR